MTQKKKVSLTGIKATGTLHIGNYLGAIREGIKLCEEYTCLYFIADMHSLTTERDPKQLQQQTYEIAAAWLAFGLDTDEHILYRQSDIPQVTEYTWYLSCFTGLGLLNKAHAYKDATAKGKEINHGVFSYPVLMASDIMMYDADVVPVGKDQKQHIEFARDMAGSVNAVYGEGVVKAPDPLINEDVMVIKGTDGEKMSKSRGNIIPLFAPPKKLRKAVMAITTDSTPLEEPKTLKGSLLEELYIPFATAEQRNELEAKLAAGNYGWGHAKEELFERMNEHLEEPRKKYEEFLAKPELLEAEFARGAERAWERAEPVLNRLRNAVGLKDSTLSLKSG